MFPRLQPTTYLPHLYALDVDTLCSCFSWLRFFFLLTRSQSSHLGLQPRWTM